MIILFIQMCVCTCLCVCVFMCTPDYYRDNIKDKKWTLAEANALCGGGISSLNNSLERKNGVLKFDRGYKKEEVFQQNIYILLSTM